MKVIWIALTALVVVGGGRTPQQVPPRDAPAGALLTASGRGSISGRVLADDAAAQPLRRVTVTARDRTAGLDVRLAVTDDEGHFELAGLPKGSYLVSAAKAAYLTSTFGSKTTKLGNLSRTTPIALTDGQHVTDIELRLVRGAVLTGVVRNPEGGGVRGVFVTLSVFLRTATSAERRLSPVAFMSSETDSDGRYRLFGIPPGDYVVMARYTHGDVATELTTGVTPASTSGRRPTYRYTPVYYPGTSDPSRATIVSVDASEERAGVDLQLGMVRTSIVEGVASGADGRPVVGYQLRLLAAVGGTIEIAGIARTESDGHFRFAGVPPGRYSLILAQTSNPAEPGFGQWAGEEITVLESQDVQANVRLQPGVSVTGRVTPETSDGATPLDLSRVRVWLSPEREGGSAKTSTTRADGQFVFVAVAPGRYRVGTQVSGTMPAGQTWGVTSAVIAGSEALDEFVDIRTDVADVRVTVSDRLSEVSGLIQNGDGRPAAEYVIVVFPADRTLWTWGSRRIGQVRPSSDGKFAFNNLPAGEYLVGAVTDVESYQWFEPAFLDQLASKSAKFSLGPGEKKVQDLTIK